MGRWENKFKKEVFMIYWYKCEDKDGSNYSVMGICAGGKMSTGVNLFRKECHRAQLKITINW